ncbi:phage tail tape measure protein [Bacteroidales bacterium OttesenSCG-928-B11]|nr:phage tail tape measure protein [Bacteroidales bacterium OttesenSCG-928-B11]MDL2326461.1 phage tail tape measure protein [Bacteroidales bacterium OttesenSCG-928-A14]
MAKSSTRRISIYINGKEVEASVKQIRSEMNKLVNEQNRMVMGSDQYIAHAKRIKELRGYLNEHSQNIGGAASAWGKLYDKAMMFGAGLGGFTQLFSTFNSAISTLKQLSLDLAALDDIYADVQKTTTLTRDKVEELNKSFKQMDTRTSREQLNNLAYIAGKLGISTQDLVRQFVEAADVINISMGDVLGDDATLAIGKMVNVFEKSSAILKEKNLKEQMLSLGAAVNELGKTSTANEKYMVNFAGRLGGIAVQAKLSADQILGYASALDQDMQKVEMSATAFQKLIQKIISKPAEFAKVAGVELKAFTALIENDMNEALKKVLKGFSGAGGFDKLVPVFQDLGLDGARAAAAISSLANSLDKVETAQATANQAMTDGVSCLKEYDIKNNNMQANLEKARKKFKDMRLELGEKLYPALMKLTKTSTAGLKLLSKTIKIVGENKAAIAALLAPYALYLTRLLLVGTAQQAHNLYTKTSIALKHADRSITLLLAAAKYKLAGNTQKATQAMKLYHAAANKVPWLAIASAITAIVIGLGKWIKSARELRKEFDFKGAHSEMMLEVNRNYEEQSRVIKDLIGIIRNENLSNDERYKAIRKLREIMPNYNAQLTEEGRLIEENTAAVENYLAVLNLKIEATAIKSKIMEAQAKLDEWELDNGKKLTGAQEKERERWRKIQAASEADWSEFGKKMKGYFAEIGSSNSRNNEDSRINRLRAQRGKLYKELTAWEEAYQKKLDEITAAGGSATETVTGEENACTGDWNSCSCADCETKRNHAAATTDANKEQLKEWEKFLKELEKMKEEERLAAFKGVEREKQKTAKEFDEQIAAAKQFIKLKGKAALEAEKELLSLKEKAIARLDAEHREKELKRVEENYKKLYDKVEELQEKLGNSLTDKYAAELSQIQRQWKETLKEIDQNIAFYQSKQSEPYDPVSGTGLSEEEIKMLEQLLEKRKQAIALEAEQELEVVAKAEAEITHALLSEKEARVAAVKKEYDERIAIAQTAIAKLKELGEEEHKDRIEQLEKQIEELKEKLEKEMGDIEASSAKKGLGKLFDIDWKNFKKDWEKNLAEIADVIQDFVWTANQLFDSINQIQRNKEERLLSDYRRKYDERRDILDHQLREGIVSQEYYNAQVEQLDKELDAREREMELEQFRREKKTAVAQAIISGILAAVKSFEAGGGFPWGLVTMALSLATTGAQVAAISSQPEPYFTGGYIEDEKLIVAGEQGREWVASNTLLSNPETAPAIEALEQYQRGNKSAWENLSFTVPNDNNLSHAATSISRNFVPANNANVINNYTATASQTDNAILENMLYEMSELRKFMSDPSNRKAVLSRDLQLQFEQQENFLRNAAAIK